MELGFSTMNTADDLPPGVVAKAVEDRGYTAFFVGEHSHIPASRLTPYPAGGDLPDLYRRIMDPFVSLAMAASSTTRLTLGLGVCLVLEHHVLDLAKAVATLDVLSGGRLLVGVGAGWNAEELANHRPDVAWAQRYRAMEECVEALRCCWSDEASEFHGEFFDFDAVWSFPKPVQRPHPPILLGTGGKLGTQHAVRWADEWMPMDRIGRGRGWWGGPHDRQVPFHRGGGRPGHSDLDLRLRRSDSRDPPSLSGAGCRAHDRGYISHGLGRSRHHDAVHRPLRGPDTRARMNTGSRPEQASTRFQRGGDPTSTSTLRRSPRRSGMNPSSTRPPQGMCSTHPDVG